MKMNKTQAIELVNDEVKRAISIHKPFHSPHEGYAVIKEELDELWDEIRKLQGFWDRNDGLKKEAIQLTAMSLRFLIDLCEG